MDWDYILSISPEDLTEEEKDDLYNTVTWFNCDGESIDLQKSVGLLKISQEVLKYKGEQVEILLHKLDELATRQGEEELRKGESDTDARSTRSRKSSSIELENLEQRYLELKSKHRKQVKINEKNLTEIKKLQKIISELEQDKQRLINEVQLINQEDNQSDISETVKEQQKELVATLQTKNKQISDLLRDIEVTESENIILREKLANVRDELAVATSELSTLTENWKATKIELAECTENVKRLTLQNESLKEEIQAIQEQKQKFEQEMEEFTAEVNLRVDQWKKILEDKDKEINELKSHKNRESLHSSESIISQDADLSHVSTLNKLLIEREDQLIEVKTRLQQAIKEMEETTLVIQDLTKVKEDNERTITELSEANKQLKKQLKNAHDRCQDLQDEVGYCEKLIQQKDSDITALLKEIKEDGHTDAEKIEQIQNLKAQVRTQEKQIMGLVKISNKSQDLCHQLQLENEALKVKLGIPLDDPVDTSEVSLKKKQVRRELHNVKSRLRLEEEEKLQLKIENRKLQKSISQLTNQIIELGESPDNVKSSQSDVDVYTKNELKALVEENEALRKGLHEIMDSLKTKKETSLTEIRSETLEQLLRALDVKHISGWYHPAMRLQAELHNQEGINAELREQLRLAKLESKSLDSARESEKSQGQLDSLFQEIKSDASFGSIQKLLEDLNKKLKEDSGQHEEIESKVKMYMENFKEVSLQLTQLYQEYAAEKQKFVDKMSEYEERINDLEESNKIKDEKLHILIEDCKSESTLMTRSLELAENNVVLLRKCSYVENENKAMQNRINTLQSSLAEAHDACKDKLTAISQENKSLTSRVNELTNQLSHSVDYEAYNHLQKDFDNLTIKYRDSLRCLREFQDNNQHKIKMMEEIQKNLQSEKAELESKVFDLLEKLHNTEFCQVENAESLSRKLADSELKEINERQRANHTNNLFELVKEQLLKSEERFAEVEKYNKELLQKNVVLQEQLKDCENKILDFVDIELYNKLKEHHDGLLNLNERLKSEIAALKEEIIASKTKDRLEKLWNSEKEEELLNLKHQIVDLQATSDEKMQIGRLSSECARLKMNENELNIKSEMLSEKLAQALSKIEELNKSLEQEADEKSSIELRLKRKIRALRDLLKKSKLQYLGSVPLSSDEKFIENLKSAISDKHAAFLNLYYSQKTASESSILKEQCERELENLEKALKVCSSDPQSIRELINNHQEMKMLYFNEIKFRRQAELKETQLQHIFDRVKIQDEQIIQLEEELFALHKNYSFDYDTELPPPAIIPQEKPKADPPAIKINKAKEVQTDEICDEASDGGDSFSSLRAELLNAGNEIAAKEQLIRQLKNKLTEYEMNISLFRKQLGDKQSQIHFYERHILELQAKSKDKDVSSGSESDDVADNEELLILKNSIKTYQESLRQKDEKILKYQSLIKEDRDKHSMAAQLMRDELKMLQKCLDEEKQKSAELKSIVDQTQPSKAALEQYFSQVHSLESELSDMHTQVSSLESQLQASRQEAVRWRTLANDRLESMQKLGRDLEELHRNEISVYKNESEKWREEVNNLKILMSRYRSELGHESDFQKAVKEKDARIHELSVMLRASKSEIRKNADKSDNESVSKLSELEYSKEQLIKENETLKKRYEQVLSRERSCREEIRDLKSKLMKKPILSARSDRSERSVKEQLQKKISSLENEIVELKENLARQVVINESHRIKASEDFDKWNKQKQWQQTAEKLKSKLKIKENDFEKLQQTCAGYRILIERLEREKFNLENKIRNLKSTASQVNLEELDILRSENMKLISENEALLSKLEMRQHHAGGLGAAMLQEKLEAQERKIAILELSTKGTAEVRAELERLQNSLTSLQKTNLRLEAENLELKLDLEKSSKETPYLKEQIQHLENYIEVLKKENAETAIPNTESNSNKADSKKISELERTIFVLKRVVEKLQVENRRLLAGKRPFSDSNDKLRRDHQRLKEQYLENIEKVTKLEADLRMMRESQNKPVRDDVITLSDELTQVKDQLEMKTQLLNKVKVLLQRAAEKEKTLLDQINTLKFGDQHSSRAEPAEKE